MPPPFKYTHDSPLGVWGLPHQALGHHLRMKQRQKSPFGTARSDACCHESWCGCRSPAKRQRQGPASGQRQHKLMGNPPAFSARALTLVCCVWGGRGVARREWRRFRLTLAIRTCHRDRGPAPAQGADREEHEAPNRDRSVYGREVLRREAGFAQGELAVGDKCGSTLGPSMAR